LVDPPWLNWVAEEGAPVPEIAHSAHYIIDGEGGSVVMQVVISTLSTVRRFLSERAPRGAYFISNVIIIDDGQPQLGELHVRLKAEGYVVTTTPYDSDGRLRVVALDGGSYDVKRRPAP
jgi:hypothetical protein